MCSKCMSAVFSDDWLLAVVFFLKKKEYSLTMKCLLLQWLCMVDPRMTINFYTFSERFAIKNLTVSVH